MRIHNWRMRVKNSFWDFPAFCELVVLHRERMMIVHKNMLSWKPTYRQANVSTRQRINCQTEKNGTNPIKQWRGKGNFHNKSTSKSGYVAPSSPKGFVASVHPGSIMAKSAMCITSRSHSFGLVTLRQLPQSWWPRSTSVMPMICFSSWGCRLLDTSTEGTRWTPVAFGPNTELALMCVPRFGTTSSSSLQTYPAAFICVISFGFWSLSSSNRLSISWLGKSIQVKRPSVSMCGWLEQLSADWRLER